MRNFRILFFIGACMLPLLAACVRDQAESLPTTHTILFAAGVPRTRTAFLPGEYGIYPTRWTARDTAVAVALNYGAPSRVRPVPTEDGGMAEFLYTFDITGTDSYAFQFLSPASAAEAMSLSRQSWQLTIPAVQTPSACSPDEAAQILSARTESIGHLPAKQELQFSHVTAYGRITLKNLPDEAAVHAVTLSCTTPLAGSWYYAPADGTLTARESSSTLTLLTSSTDSVWFACAPGDVSGATMKVIVSTDLGTYEKAITLLPGRSFKPGRVAAFTVDFQGVEPLASGEEYLLVTDAASLSAGDELLIVDQEGKYALGTTQKSSNRDAAAVRTESGRIVSGAGNAEHITLQGRSDAWLLQVASGEYLYTVSSRNRLLTTNNGKLQDLYTWTIDIASDGTASIAAPYSGGERYLQFNKNQTSNLLFSCYSSPSQSPVSLYRKVSRPGNPYEEDPVLAQRDYGAYLAAATKRYIPGSSQLSRESDADGVRFAILTPSTQSVIEFAGIPLSPLVGDSFSLTYREYRGAKVSETVFPVTVLKVDGARVWLSDGKNNGFIVKK